MAPIHVAARNMDVDALRLELERGVDPNLREAITSDKTPLQLVYIPHRINDTSERLQASLNCFRLLLENGASVDVRDVINDTRLHDACLHNNPAIVALLDRRVRVPCGILLKVVFSSSLRILIF